MISNSMRRAMTYTVSTKRRPVPDSNGKQGVPVTYLTALKTTPIDPLNTDEFHNLILRYNLEEPYRIFGSYCETTQDVQSGDIIVWNGREFVVRGLGVWDSGLETMYEMILVEMAS